MNPEPSKQALLKKREIIQALAIAISRLEVKIEEFEAVDTSEPSQMKEAELIELVCLGQDLSELSLKVVETARAEIDRRNAVVWGPNREKTDA